MKLTALQTLIEYMKGFPEYADSGALIQAEFLLSQEKQQIFKARENGRQAEYERQFIKKGLRPHDISHEEYYSSEYPNL